MMINESTAEIYTKESCPFCVYAKKLLDEKGVEYTEICAVENRDELIARVTEASGSAPRTVPQIFLDGAYIGGYDNLVAHYKKIDDTPPWNVD